MCPVRVLCYMSMRSRARDSHTRCGLQACPCNMVSDFCACDKSVLVRRCARAHHISVHVIVCCSNVRVCCVHVRACASRCWQQRALCMSHACVCPLLEYACVSLLVCSCASVRVMSARCLVGEHARALQSYIRTCACAHVSHHVCACTTCIRVVLAR